MRFLDDEGKEVYYHGQKSVEINLSTKHRFTFYPDKNVFVREDRKAPLPDDFWARTNAAKKYRNIYNINVIAGQNGSGKTTAIRCVMNLLEFFYSAASGEVKKANSFLWAKRNQSLLLLEDNSQYYLLSYIPTGENAHKSVHIEGFSNNEPLIYGVIKLDQLFIDKDRTSKDIRELILKTKVIHITNTLNQYDYERNIGKQYENSRDCFVFDVSIGATIGPEVGRFFPYEIYKQVKYVFDKNQSEIRKKIEKETRKKITGFKVPDSLRFRLRIEEYKKVYENINIFDKSDDGGSNLVEALGALCVCAFIENLKTRSQEDHFPDILSTSIEENREHISTKKLLQQMILNVEQHYYDYNNCRSFYRHNEHVLCLESLPDGRIVSGSKEGRILIWNAINDCDEILQIDGEINCIVYYSPNRIVAGTNDGTLWIIDMVTGNPLYRGEMGADPIIDITVSPDGKRIYCASETGTAFMIDGDKHDLKYTWKMNSGRKKVNGIFVNQNGRIFCCGDDGLIYTSLEGELYSYLNEELSRVTCMILLPNNQMLLGKKDGYLYVWDPQSTKDTLRVWKEGHSGAVKCMALSPDRSKLVSATIDGEIYVWDSNTEKCLYKMNVTKMAGIRTLAILSDGRVFGCVRNNGFYTCNVPGGVFLRKEQKRMLKAIEEDDSNKSKSTIKNKEETEKRIRGMGFEHILAENCLRYIKYIFEKKEAFFSRIHKIRSDLYEISLKENRTDEFAQDMIQFMQKYRYTCEPAYTIDFDWGLSSGEENMLRIFSDLYHIFDRDYSSGEYGDYKIYNKENSRHTQGEKKECDTVLLFMDEADLTLHPEWQRCLIETLTTYIPQVYPASCVKDIQLILTTHSPLLLGDIPSENIAYLYRQKDNEGNDQEENKRDEREKDVKIDSCKPGETFGQNIHTILKDSFFLKDGTVGAFAAEKINNAAKRLTEIEEWASGENKQTVAVKTGEMEKIRMIIDLVAPGVLRNQLEELYKDANDALVRLACNNQNINSIKAQGVMLAEQLVQAIKNLPKQERDYVLEKLEQEE